MKKLFLLFVCLSASGAQIDIDNTQFPWINGGSKNTFKLSDYKNAVFVFEAFQYN